MGKKGLKDNEAKLANIIDNLSKNGQKISKTALNPSSLPRPSHVHLKKISNLVIKRNEIFQVADIGLNFSVPETKLIFAYYMISYKLSEPNSMYMKLFFNGREVKESRQALGDTKIGSLSGSFAETYNPNGKKVNLNAYFKSLADGKITDEGEDNFTIGAISMAAGKVFKHDNSVPIELKKSKDWIGIPNFELNVTNDAPKEFYFLIFYNFSIKLEAKNTLGIVLQMNNKPIRVY